MTDTSTAPENTVTPTPANLDPAVAQYIQAHPEFAWMATDPELGPLLTQSVLQQWTAEKWQENLQGTNWFKTHNAAARSWIELAGSDPAEASSRVQSERENLQAATNKLGVRLTDGELNSLAYQALEYGWSDQEIQNHLGKMIVYRNGQFQVSPFYIDPTTGHEVDSFTGRRAYYGPNGEAASPQPPPGWVPTQPGVARHPGEGMAGWATWTQPDGTVVYYRTQTGAPEQMGPNGQLVDTTTGRRAYFGPNGEPGTPDENTAIQTWGQGNYQTFQQSDGTTVFYKAGTAGGATAQPGGGLLGSTMADLKATAAQYLVPVSDQTLAQWAQQIAAGQTDPKAFESYVKDQAKSLFPTMAASIDAGITPTQYTDPYRQVASTTLGLDPNSINMLDPKWQRAVTQKDPKSGMPTAMSLYDWQSTLMSDPTYGYMKTQNASQRVSALVAGLGQMFGRDPGGGPGFGGVAAPSV